jgi:hypothetical protein
MMAAFAGQMIGYAQRLLGHHVREDLRAALQKLLPQASPPVRQRAARVLEAPPGHDQAQEPRRRRG